MLAWISNYIYYKVWVAITYPFPNLNGAAVFVVDINKERVKFDKNVVIISLRPSDVYMRQ